MCSFRFELLKSRMIVLFVAGTSRAFLISFGVHYWFVIIFVLLYQNTFKTYHSSTYLLTRGVTLGTLAIASVMLL